jgi:hypothetical protein
MRADSNYPKMMEIRQAAHLLIGIWGLEASEYARLRRAHEMDDAARRTWSMIVEEVDRYIDERMD